MKEQNQETPSVNYGVKLDQIPQIIDPLKRIYEKVTGHKLPSYADYYFSQESLKKDFLNSRDLEFRFGSRLTCHSKLWIRKSGDLLFFRFDSNLSRQNKEGEKTENEFQKEINKYLKESGIGQKLNYY